MDNTNDFPDIFTGIISVEPMSKRKRALCYKCDTKPLDARLSVEVQGDFGYAKKYHFCKNCGKRFIEAQIRNLAEVEKKLFLTEEERKNDDKRSGTSDQD